MTKENAYLSTATSKTANTANGLEMETTSSPVPNVILDFSLTERFAQQLNALKLNSTMDLAPALTVTQLVMDAMPMDVSDAYQMQKDFLNTGMVKELPAQPHAQMDSDQLTESVSHAQEIVRFATPTQMSITRMKFACNVLMIHSSSEKWDVSQNAL